MRPICFFTSSIQSTYSIAEGNVAHIQFLTRRSFPFQGEYVENECVSACAHICVCVRASVCVAETEQENSSILFGLEEHCWWCQQTRVKMSCQGGLRSKLTLRQTPACSIFPSRLRHGCGRHREQLSLPGTQAAVQPGGFLKLKITVITKKSTTQSWLILFNQAHWEEPKGEGQGEREKSVEVRK